MQVQPLRSHSGIIRAFLFRELTHFVDHPVNLLSAFFRAFLVAAHFFHCVIDPFSYMRIGRPCEKAVIFLSVRSIKAQGYPRILGAGQPVYFFTAEKQGFGARAFDNLRQAQLLCRVIILQDLIVRGQ